MLPKPAFRGSPHRCARRPEAGLLQELVCALHRRDTPAGGAVWGAPCSSNCVWGRLGTSTGSAVDPAVHTCQRQRHRARATSTLLRTVAMRCQVPQTQHVDEKLRLCPSLTPLPPAHFSRHTDGPPPRELSPPAAPAHAARPRPPARPQPLRLQLSSLLPPPMLWSLCGRTYPSLT